MKYIPAITMAAAIWIGAARSTTAQGTVIFQHLGAIDPATEGFNLIGQGSVGPVVGDLGMDAWFIATATYIPPNTCYSQALTLQQADQLAGADWVLSLTLRVVSSAGTVGNNEIDFNTGSQRFFMDFGSEPNGDPFLWTSSQRFVFSGAGPGYHNYQLRYSAVLGTADLWVDGVQQLTGLGLLAGFLPGGVLWGEGQGGPSQANWNLVSLEIIPEPSAVSLILLGSGVLIYVRRTWKHCRS